MSVPPTQQPTITLFDLLRSRKRDGQKIQFELNADWQQGRTTFGGALAVMAVQAIRDICGNSWPLRALQTHFVGPVSVGACDIEVTLLRQGKNIRQVQARILQGDAQGNDQTACVLVGVFGTGRESSLPVLSPVRPQPEKGPNESFQLPFIPGVTPTFTQHLDYRVASGGLPFMGSDAWHNQFHIRLRHGDGIDMELQTVMLADAAPTPALQQLKGLAPASSVSWALELRPILESDDRGFWQMDKEALASGEGYVNERTSLWTPSGQLAALGYQVVAVYA